jgi:hypothetical protein
MRITEESQSHNCSLELILRPARSDAGAFLFAPPSSSGSTGFSLCP